MMDRVLGVVGRTRSEEEGGGAIASNGGDSWGGGKKEREGEREGGRGTISDKRVS